MSEFATTSRHLHIHFIIVLHYDKGIIPVPVKRNLGFLFITKLGERALKDIFTDYWNFPKDIRKFEDFFMFMLAIYEQYKYGVLLIDRLHNKYNPHVSEWFN